jgi:hypothetical protein
MAQSKRRTKRKSGKGKPRTPKDEGKIVGGAVVTLIEGPGGQVFDVKPVEGTTVRELPTLFRQTAQHVERQLVGE